MKLRKSRERGPRRGAPEPMRIDPHALQSIGPKRGRTSLGGEVERVHPNFGDSPEYAQFMAGAASRRASQADGGNV